MVASCGLARELGGGSALQRGPGGCGGRVGVGAAGAAANGCGHSGASPWRARGGRGADR